MAAFDEAHRQQVTAVDIACIDGDQIYLILAIHRPHIAGRSGPIAADLHDDHTSIFGYSAPLALHAVDAVADLEAEVIATLFGDWLHDRDPELGRGKLDGELRHCTLDVW